MTDDLWLQYQTTSFVLPEACGLLSEGRCTEFAVISARNPGSKQQYERLNLESERHMECILKQRYQYCRILGCSPSFDYIEPSFLIHLPSKKVAIELSRLFKQKALFWVCDDQLFLVPCDDPFVSVVTLGKFTERLMDDKLVINKLYDAR